MAKPVRKSPILGAVTTMIGEASGTLVVDGGRFRHSFEVALDSLTPDAAQARKTFNATEIAALALTMAEQGQLQPILVRRDPQARNRWVIVAGERRYRAARLNNWPSLLAIEHGGDPEVAALIENLQRVDLQPLEEARGLQRLIRDKSWSQDRAAAALGKAKSDISATLRILSLPEDLLDQVLTSEPDISKNVLVEMARVENAQALTALAQLAGTGGLTIRAVRMMRTTQGVPRAPRQTPGPADHSWRLQGVALVRRSLEQARIQRLPLDQVDRAALERLRTEINTLLQE
jgi:ParB family chromosome partitioning protein